jgi:hypothetical protein
MKQFLFSCGLLFVTAITYAQLPANKDWLITKTEQSANIIVSQNGNDIVLDNGLVSRSFSLQPNLACVNYKNVSDGEELLRAVSPEAVITIDGKKYNVGGLYGQSEKAYFKSEWLDHLKANGMDFQFKSYEISQIIPYINWKQSGWAANNKQPAGKTLSFQFQSAQLPGILVYVHYELYDGIPLICKWVSVVNKSKSAIKIDKLENEVLAVPEEEAAVAGETSQLRAPHGIYIESNYEFNDSMTAKMSDQTTHWNTDTTYTSQVSYALKTPCLLEVYPPIGPGVTLNPGAEFKSMRSNELLMDGYDRERNGLAQRRMYYTIAPWATQNPIYMFVKSMAADTIRKAIDQCAAVGFEMIVVGFSTNFMEDTTKANMDKWTQVAAYAHSKGIKMGGYSLLSSRHISDSDDVIDPVTLKPDVAANYAAAPCLGSQWGLAYFQTLKHFYKTTGFDEFDQDGTYAGDVCASTSHPGHKGLDDSQWNQMELQKGFYHWCAENGIFVNTPDWYFLDGGSKCALGYREVNFSLPREQQVILNRQNIYDGTWEKMPSMGWGFVPLTEYHGGGAAATIEPLSQHLDQYQQLMMQYFGSGVQACYLGTRLYDTETTKKVVKNVISWYKQHRLILNAQIIHLRRPDGRDWDGIMHVDPAGKEKGLAMFYNPTNQKITRTIKLPLYYTGLSTTAKVRKEDGKTMSYKVNRDYTIDLAITIKPESYSWYVIQ